MHYPQREGEPDCRDFIRTGRCKYGESCKYNHPAGGGTTLSDPTEPLFPLRPDEPPCSYYLKHGFCKFGQACKFHHPLISPEHYSEDPGPLYINIDFPKETVGVHSTDSSVVMNDSISFQTLPQRPGELNCTHYMRFGTCKFGFHCRYNHPLREEYAGDVFDRSHDLITKNSRKDDRGRSFSMGSLLEARNYPNDGYERHFQPSRTSLNTLFNPKGHLTSRNHRHIRVENTKVDHENVEASQNGLSGYGINTSSSSQISAQFLLSESQGLLQSSFRNESRGRSLSNDDLSKNNASGYVNASLQRSYQKNSTLIPSSYDTFSTHRPTQSENNSIPDGSMDQNRSLTITDVSSLSFRNQLSEKHLFSEKNAVIYNIPDKYANQPNYPGHHHTINSVSPSIFHPLQPEQNMSSDDHTNRNLFNENAPLGTPFRNGSPTYKTTSNINHDYPKPDRRLSDEKYEDHHIDENTRTRSRLEFLDQNNVRRIHQSINNGFRTSLTCAKQLEQSMSASQSDDPMVSLGKQMEWPLMFQMSPSSKKENTIFCENGHLENLWKYP